MNKLVFDDIEVSKKGAKLSSVDVNKIVVSNKVKGNNETSKVFISYLDDIDVILMYYVTTNEWLDKVF